MDRIRNCFLAAAMFAFLVAGAAVAQQYNLQGGAQGQSVGSSVIDDLNIAGNAQPVSATNPLPTAPQQSAAITNPSSTLTLPAATTAYTSGELIANSATAGSVVVPSFAIANVGGGAIIQKVRLNTNDATSTAWPGKVIQVDLWSAPPSFTNGDRGAFLPASGTAGHLGAFTCTMSAEYGDGAYADCAPTIGSALVIRLPSGTGIFWTLQTTGSGVTGASNVFRLTAEVQN